MGEARGRAFGVAPCSFLVSFSWYLSIKVVAVLPVLAKNSSPLEANVSKVL